MSNTNTNCIIHPNLLTGIAVVGVVVISIGLINVFYVTEEINNLSTQLSDLRCNYVRICVPIALFTPGLVSWHTYLLYTLNLPLSVNQVKQSLPTCML